MEDFSFFLNNKIGGDFITFKYRYRKQIFIATIITIFIVTISIIIFLTLNNKNDSKEEPLLVEKKEPKKEKSKTSKELVKVDIKGAINNPGIYSLNTDSRVVDVIEMAGGLTEEADTSVINLSKKLSDEMVIIIYTKTEVKDFENIKAIEVQVQEKCNQKDENSLKNDACITGDNTVQGKVSINKGTLEELQTLTGIGESKAKDIIAYREANGPFSSIEDLTKVSGIGESTLAKIKEDITL